MQTAKIGMAHNAHNLLIFVDDVVLLILLNVFVVSCKFRFRSRFNVLNGQINMKSLANVCVVFSDRVPVLQRHAFRS